MKRFLLLLSLLFLIPINCFASVKTNTRTRDNLLVPKDVIVNNNLNDILNTPAVSSDEKVYDFIDLFSELDREKIIKKVSHYKKITGMDTVIVITNDLKGFSLSDYSYHFYDYNDFDYDGIILVIYIDKEKPRIFMGSMGKAISFYSDRRIKQTLSYIYKDIKNKNYYQAVFDYQNIVEGFYVHDMENAGTYYIDKEGNFVLAIPWIELIVLSFSLTFIMVFFLLNVFKKKKKKLNDDFLERSLDSSTLIVKLLSEEKITEDI